MAVVCPIPGEFVTIVESGLFQVFTPFLGPGRKLLLDPVNVAFLHNGSPSGGSESSFLADRFGGD